MKNREIKLNGDRLSMFSDGVIAIIITLMILGIELPKIDKNATSQQIWSELSTMVPSLIAYIISFFSLAIFWANHHNFFHMIKHIDRGLMWLNMNLLFLLSLIPLPTAFLAQHFQNPIGVMLYSISMFLCNAQFGIVFYYAKRQGLFIDKFNMERGNQIIRLIVYACTLWLVSIPVAYVSVYLSFAIYLFIALMFVFPKNIEIVEEDE